MPFAELWTGVLLMIGALPLLASGAAVLMSSSFVIALGVNAWRGRVLDCHCFGTSRARRVGWQEITRTTILLMGSLLLFAAAAGNALPPWPADPRLVAPMLAMAVLAALTYMLMVAGLDQMR